MSRRHLIGSIPLLASSAALAADGNVAAAASPEVGGIALAGIVAAYAWHWIAPHRRELAQRWHDFHPLARFHPVDWWHHHQFGHALARLHVVPRHLQRRRRN